MTQHFNYYPPQPPPQPGVVPLRPLDVGAVIGGSLKAIFRNWQAALLLPFGLYLGVSVVGGLSAIKPFRSMGTAIDNHRGLSSGTIWGIVIVAVVGIVLTVAATLIVQTATTVVVSRAVLGRSTSIGQALRAARPRMLPMLGLDILITLMFIALLLIPFGVIAGCIALAVSGGHDGEAVLLGVLGFLLLLVAAGFGIYFGVSFTVAPSALILESVPAPTALRRSRRLVRDNWWRTLGIPLLAGLMASLAGYVVQLPISAIQYTQVPHTPDPNQPFDLTFSPTVLVVSFVVSAAVSAFSQPFLIAVGTLLYHDLRIRKESFHVPLLQMSQLPDDLSPRSTPPPRASWS
jgi:hypothetical protein